MFRLFNLWNLCNLWLISCAIQPQGDVRCRSLGQIRQTLQGYSQELKPYYPDIKKYAEQQHLSIHALTTVRLSFTILADGKVDYVTVKFPYLQEPHQLVDLYILSTLQQKLNQAQFPEVDASCGPYRVENFDIDFSNWLEY